MARNTGNGRGVRKLALKATASSSSGSGPTLRLGEEQSSIANITTFLPYSM